MKTYNVKSNYLLKDIDEKSNVISAYVSVFGNIDSDGDMVVKGAYTKTISERGPGSQRPRIKHLWMHSPFDIIGVPIEMVEDQKGLLVRSKFGTDTFSRDKMQQHIDGLVDEFSIGYEVMNAPNRKVHEGVEYNELSNLKLWEYSSVTWGANELTHIIEGKSSTPEMVDRLNERMTQLIGALKNGRYTDESAEQFEIELKQIQTIYNQLIKREGPAESTPRGPSGDTLQDEEVRELLNILKR